MEIKKTTQFAGKIKGLHFAGSALLDEDECIIDLTSLLRAAYGDKNFDLSVTSKTEEIIDTDVEEVEDTDEE